MPDKTRRLVSSVEGIFRCKLVMCDMVLSCICMSGSLPCMLGYQRNCYITCSFITTFRVLALWIERIVWARHCLALGRVNVQHTLRDA